MLYAEELLHLQAAARGYILHLFCKDTIMLVKALLPEYNVSGYLYCAGCP